MSNKYRLLELHAVYLIPKQTENYPILNQIYDILVEFQNQDKQIILCKIPAHTVIKWNEEANKAAKQTIDMSGITNTRLTYTEYK